MKLFLPIVLLVTELGAMALPQNDKPRPDLAFLVEAERSFSRTCVAKGLRESFVEFFASYGKYSLLRKNTGALEKGYYVRVWKRDGKGNWKIAMDVANALFPEPRSNGEGR